MTKKKKTIKCKLNYTSYSSNKKIKQKKIINKLFCGKRAFNRTRLVDVVSHGELTFNCKQVQKHIAGKFIVIYTFYEIPHRGYFCYSFFFFFIRCFLLFVLYFCFLIIFSHTLNYFIYSLKLFQTLYVMFVYDIT